MERKKDTKFKCVLHGSFVKHFQEIKRIHELFSRAGIEVIAPEFSEIIGSKAGFAILKSDTIDDPRMIELLYLRNLKRLGSDGFSYFVNPEGYMGRSVSYELGIAQISNARCFFMEKLQDHPAYVHKNSIWGPESLAEFIKSNGCLPSPQVKRNELVIHRLWEGLMVPGSIVAVGGIIEYASSRSREKRVLLVKTHKWGGRDSMVVGRVRRSERLDAALLREIKDENGLTAKVDRHICTFDQIKNSGYYNSAVNHIFVDKVAEVVSKRAVLNEEAEEYIWLPPRIALRDLNIEPNARHTLELYAKMIPGHAI